MKILGSSKSYFVSALFGLMALNTQAATISLSPTSATTVNIGGVVSFNMIVDAADVGGILAGGLDLFYNFPTGGVFSYNGDFAFDSGFPTDPSFSRLGDDCATAPTANCSGPGEINGIAFGHFFGLAATGPTQVGTLSFTGMAAGTSLFGMSDNDAPAGSWFNTAGDSITLNYIGSSAVVTPVPAAVWLFGSGLLGLIGIARHEKVA